jgi:hypothetical protein
VSRIGLLIPTVGLTAKALKHRFDWDEIVQMVEKVQGSVGMSFHAGVEIGHGQEE